MCGRFSLVATIEELREHFGLRNTPGAVLVPRYNIAPGQVVLLIENGYLNFVTWGIKLPHNSNFIINSQIETVATKKMFKSGLQQRRCLVIASGFFEWKAVERKKIPYYFQDINSKLIGLAGIMVGDNCVILTTKTNLDANPLFFHDRTPVMIKSSAYNLWLNPKTALVDILDPKIQINQKDLITYPVSSQVNNPKFDNITCIRTL